MLKYAAVLLLSAGLTAAQSEDQQITTQAPANAVYEIRQAGSGWSGTTYRLNRVSGQVARLERMPDGSSAWVEMPVTDLPLSSSLPRFQLSNVGNSVNAFLLLDTLSGQTWRLSYAIGKNGVNDLNVWLPVKSEKN